MKTRTAILLLELALSLCFGVGVFTLAAAVCLLAR